MQIGATCRRFHQPSGYLPFARREIFEIPLNTRILFFKDFATETEDSVNIISLSSGL